MFEKSQDIISTMPYHTMPPTSTQRQRIVQMLVFVGANTKKPTHKNQIKALQYTFVVQKKKYVYKI